MLEVPWRSILHCILGSSGPYKVDVLCIMGQKHDLFEDLSYVMEAQEVCLDNQNH